MPYGIFRDPVQAGYFFYRQPPYGGDPRFLLKVGLITLRFSGWPPYGGDPRSPLRGGPQQRGG